MLFTALLTAFVTWSLTAGSLPNAAAIALGIVVGAAFWIFGRHTHDGIPAIDLLARKSRFAGVNAALKVWSSSILLALCICSQSVWPPLALLFLMALLTVAVGGLPLQDYLSLLALPAAFLLLSGLALLWDFAPSAVGVVDLPCFGGYFTVLPAAQISARLVMARALGAVSCLYLLSLSTPMPEILSVLRRAHVPSIVIELAVLIYRYIFILLATHRNMKDAAASRLGFGPLKRSLRTTGKLYGNLLSRSFRRAGAYFDAMESRCYAGDIRFLDRVKPIVRRDAVLFGTLILAAALAVVSTYL